MSCYWIADDGHALKVLLDLPHRQFVFTLPKAPPVFFRHDRRLFEDTSRLIFNLMHEFYQEVAGRMLLTGLIVAHQTFGDMVRWNPHSMRSFWRGWVR